MLEYDTLRMIWWLLIGVILVGFAITDGFDLGIAALLPYLGRTEEERRLVVYTIEPFWESNQTWFILLGGALFAAWPIVYAVSFAGFYSLMFILLAALILRPVAFKFRNKEEGKGWRSRWDIIFQITGLIPCIVFGILFGNLLQGIPFKLDPELRMIYMGTWIELLNPFALYCSVLSFIMLGLQGLSYLTFKTREIIQIRAADLGIRFAVLTCLFFLLGGMWMYFLPGYQITSTVPANQASYPLYKTVITVPNSGLHNHTVFPWLKGIVLLTILATGLCIYSLKKRRGGWALLASSTVLASIIATAGFSLYPFLIPSNLHSPSSLTLWDASSSQLTLQNMLIAAIVFFPIVLSYTTWIHTLFRKPVTLEDLKQHY
jgi:cytochrome d ubiquinol oxidase subunit II